MASVPYTGLGQANNFWMVNNRSLDAKYKNGEIPWSSKQEALDAIPIGQRADVTVKIGSTEWWWRDGEEDADLIQKLTGGGDAGSLKFGVDDTLAQEDRFFDLNGHALTLEDGVFTHGTGDYIDFADAYSSMINDVTGFRAGVSDGAGNSVDFGLNVNSGGQINMSSTNVAGNSSFSFGNNLISFWNINGNITIPFLTEAAQPYALQYDPATGKLTYAAGGSGAITSANNGLTLDTGLLQLGGPLVKNTAIDGVGAYNLTLNNTGATSASPAILTLNTGLGGGILINTTATSTAAYPLKLTGLLGMSITSTGQAINTKTTSDISIPVVIQLLPATTFNTEKTHLAFQLTVSQPNLPANGIGTGISFQMPVIANGVPSSTNAARISVIMTDITAATKQAKMSFSVCGGALGNVYEAMFVEGNGRFNLTKYGQNTFGGTPLYALGVNASGQLVEFAPSSGGSGGGITAAHGVNGLSDGGAIDTVKLGGSLLENTTIAGTSFGLFFTSARTGTSATLDITNTSTGRALNITNNSGGIGINVTTGASVGVAITSTTVTGLTVGSQTSAATFSRTQSGANTASPIITLTNNPSGNVAGTNFGGTIQMNLATSDSSATVGFFGYRWTTATTASRVGQWEISVSDSNQLVSTMHTIKGTGQHQLNKYGAGTITGTPSYSLAVDALGNLIEVAATGSGMSNPMNAVGDLIVGGIGGTPTRLPLNPTLGAILQVTGVNTIGWTTGTNWGGGIALSGTSASTQTLDQNATLMTFNGSSPATWTLPGRAASFKMIHIKNAGSANLTVSRGGTDQIWTNAAVTTVTLSPGDAISLYPTNGYWTVIFSNSVSGGGSVTPETNTASGTLTTSGNITVPVESVIEYIVVNPASQLTAFTAGTSGSATQYVPSTTIPAGVWTTLTVNEYVSGSTAVVFAGITSSTQIKVVYKPLH